MSTPATSPPRADSDAASEDPQLVADGEDLIATVDEHGFRDPADSMFATGHYTEDRLVWFDYLTVTLDDIMRECSIPEEQREEQRLLSRFSAKEFLRYYGGPETAVPLLEE